MQQQSTHRLCTYLLVVKRGLIEQVFVLVNVRGGAEEQHAKDGQVQHELAQEAFLLVQDADTGCLVDQERGDVAEHGGAAVELLGFWEVEAAHPHIPRMGRCGCGCGCGCTHWWLLEHCSVPGDFGGVKGDGLVVGGRDGGVFQQAAALHLCIDHGVPVGLAIGALDDGAA